MMIVHVLERTNVQVNDHVLIVYDYLSLRNWTEELKDANEDDVEERMAYNHSNEVVYVCRWQWEFHEWN